MRFDDKNFIAKAIKDARKRAKLTQEELAEKVDLSVQHVSRLECGAYIPNLSTFFKIVKILDINLEIFGYKKNEHTIQNELYEILNQASKPELELYYNLILTAQKSIPNFKI